MADPHSVWTLLTEVIRSAKMAVDCKVECELLATRLEGFKQPVMEIEKNSKKGNVRCKEWLTEFKGLLERARRVTNECARRTTLKFLRSKKLPARVVEISSQIEESTTWASIFLPVRSNCCQCDALAEVYDASMERISSLVLLAPLLCMETSTGHHDDALLFLLRSLAEIKRCICKGTIYTSSCPVGLEVPFIDHSGALCLSRMGSFLLRDFSFCMALVQVAFYRFITKLYVSDILENPVGWKDNKVMAEEFCKGQLFDFFERCGEGCGKSCERSCRPVLKQQFVECGQQVVQHPSVTEYLRQLLRGSEMDLASPWKQVLEAEPNPKPTNLGLVKIDYAQDIQQGGYLGNGSFGAVFKCRWRDQDMVVKIIDLWPEYEKLFEKEVTILSSVQHPNAVQIFGFGYRTEGTQRQGFILMERMEMDLSRLIQEMREGGDSTPGLVFPLDITLDLLFQIVEGMCYMKEKGVIHRDIKPANILVNRLDKGRDPFDRFYHLKLADFGTSNVNEANSVFNTAKRGTTAYMAPEVMSPTIIDEETGNRGYTFKADVYSFGMVCSEILTGKKPFQHIRSPKDIHSAVRAGERPDLPLDDVDPLRRLIEDCWSRNPGARPNIWQVRQRLWECRVYCISKLERPAMNWKTFHTDLESRSQAIRYCQYEMGGLFHYVTLLITIIGRDTICRNLQGCRFLQIVCITEKCDKLLFPKKCSVLNMRSFTRSCERWNMGPS
jgi:serine/threonine protein kinase